MLTLAPDKSLYYYYYFFTLGIKDPEGFGKKCIYYYYYYYYCIRIVIQVIITKI